ncbi:MAG: hypothetical protein CV088_21825 [Nitrospira sp. LK70]|nr:hypothetical protein [Nitrospira sp. LK70]
MSSIHPHESALSLFLVTESEALAYHYELALQANGGDLTPDPRIAHSFTLSVNEYGDPQQTVAVGYPRLGQRQDVSVPAGAQALISQVQSEVHVTYTELHYTDRIVYSNRLVETDTHRQPVSCEVVIYELTGLAHMRGTYFTLKDLRGYAFSATYPPTVEPGKLPIPVVRLEYHQQSPANVVAMRLIDHTRTLYFADDLKTPLPLGQLSALGLVYEQYKLALTHSLLSHVFGKKLTQAMNKP